MSKLRIYISGLCVLVPVGVKTKDDGTAKCDELHVLFANASSEERIEEVLGHKKLDVHKPLIIYHHDNLASNQPNFPYLLDSSGFSGLFELDREEVVIETDKDGVIFENQDIIGGERGAIPNDDNKHSVQWFSPLLDRNGNIRPVKKGLVQTPLEDSENCLSGRIIIKDGRLRVAGNSFKKRTRRHRIFDVDGRRQAVATCGLIEVDIPTDSFRIKASAFPETRDSYSVRRFKLKAVQENIDIFLDNPEYNELTSLWNSNMDPSVINNRLRMEDPFLFKLLQDSSDLHPVRYCFPAFEGAYSPDPNYKCFFESWSSRYTPSPEDGGESGEAGGCCRPRCAKDPNTTGE